MNQEQLNAFDAHYQRHSVNDGLFHAMTDAIINGCVTTLPLDSDMDEFARMLWLRGLCIVPVESLT